MVLIFVLPGERYDPEPKSKWDEEWDKKSAFPFSDKLGELSDKIGSTIDDTISKFRRKDREDSPERCRYWSYFNPNLSVRLLLESSCALLSVSYNTLPSFVSVGKHAWVQYLPPGLLQVSLALDSSVPLAVVNCSWLPSITAPAAGKAGNLAEIS